MIRGVLVVMVAAGLAAPALAELPADEVREALQKLNDFIGEWKGTGGPDKPRPSAGDPMWKETIHWEWKFRKEQRWLAFKIDGGDYWNAGELNYAPDKKKYILTIEPIKGEKVEFTGTRDAKGYLTFDRQDASGEQQQLTMNTAGDGIRFVYRYAVKPKDRKVFTKIYQVAATKDGESLASKPGSTGNECIVTGGKATIAVSYKGKTYYVCCTGCRDAFLENPEKYINEAKK